MRTDTEHILEESIDLALANGYHMVNYFYLVDVNGYFMPPKDIRKCHPLETLILGEEIVDCVNIQICEKIGTSPHWLQGFLDGYKFRGKCYDNDYYGLPRSKSCRMQYIEGCADGMEVKDWIIDLGITTS